MLHAISVTCNCASNLSWYLEIIKPPASYLFLCSISVQYITFQHLDACISCITSHHTLILKTDTELRPPPNILWYPLKLSKKNWTYVNLGVLVSRSLILCYEANFWKLLIRELIISGQWDLQPVEVTPFGPSVECSGTLPPRWIGVVGRAHCHQVIGASSSGWGSCLTS